MGGRQGEGVTVAFHIQGIAKEYLKLAEPLYYLNDRKSISQKNDYGIEMLSSEANRAAGCGLLEAAKHAAKQRNERKDCRRTEHFANEQPSNARIRREKQRFGHCCTAGGSRG